MAWDEQLPRSGEGMTVREVVILAAVALTLASVAAPRFASGLSKRDEPVLAKNLRLVEQAKDAFILERNLLPGTPVELLQLVRAGYLKQIPNMPPGLVIHPGKVGEAVHLDEREKP